MKITKSQLKQIIKEELNLLSEDFEEKDADTADEAYDEGYEDGAYDSDSQAQYWWDYDGSHGTEAGPYYEDYKKGFAAGLRAEPASEESIEDEGSPWQEYITNNPLHGMSPEMSQRMFSGWLPMMVQYGHIASPRSFDDIIAAYDKLRTIQDPEDRSHDPLHMDENNQ